MNNPVLVTMAGPKAVDIRSLSNFEAGVAMLGLIHRVFPGITFGQLPALASQGSAYRSGAMAGWWTDLKKGAGNAISPTKTYNGIADKLGDVKDGIGDILKDSTDATGGAFGDFIRLISDKEVIDGANSSYESFTGSGGIWGAVGGSGFSDFMGGESGGEGGGEESGMNSFMSWISHLGSSAKDQANKAGVGGIPGGVLPWAIAGGAVLFFVFGKKDK